MALVRFLLASLLSALRVTALNDGKTVIVNGISYYAPTEAVSNIIVPSQNLKVASSGDLIPMTVLEDTSSLFNLSVFASIVDNYTATDDVFNTGFLSGKYALQCCECC